MWFSPFNWFCSQFWEAAEHVVSACAVMKRNMGLSSPCRDIPAGNPTLLLVNQWKDFGLNQWEKNSQTRKTSERVSNPDSSTETWPLQRDTICRFESCLNHPRQKVSGNELETECRRQMKDKTGYQMMVWCKRIDMIMWLYMPSRSDSNEKLPWQGHFKNSQSCRIEIKEGHHLKGFISQQVRHENVYASGLQINESKHLQQMSGAREIQFNSFIH